MKRLQTKKRESVAFDYEKDGSSNEGMQTSVWGPILWTFLHIMSFNYPVQPTEEDKIHYKGFVEHLQYILPCKKCRENLPKNMIRARYGDQCFKNRKEFSQFFWRLHNEVSRAINKDPKNASKKIIEYSYDEVAEKFESIRASCSSSSAEKKVDNYHLGCMNALPGKKPKKCTISIFKKRGVCKASTSLRIKK